MYPKIYDHTGQQLAILDNIIKESASIKRVVNGEFTFSFEAFEKELKSEYFDKGNNIYIEDQTFDIKYIEQTHESNVTYNIECEHVNYRLEDGEDNLYTSYAVIGTPTQILTDILSGTEFSVGSVNYTDVIAISINEEITRKKLIYQLVNALGGEIEYTNRGFTINILNTIGQNNGYEIRLGKNLKAITKIIDNRGGLKTYYTVDILALKNSNEYIENNLQELEVIGVGDTIRIIDQVIGLDIENRIISREYNPIFEINTNLEIANTIDLITDKINQIETNTIKQNKLYNNVSISSEEGFIAIRSDNKAKTVINATEGHSIYSDTGNGLVKNFFVDMDGRIKAKFIDILEDGTFGGAVKANQILIGGDNGYISFNDLIDAPDIPTIPSYIKSTYIDSIIVQSPTIVGGTVTGGVLKTIDGSAKRIVIDTHGIISYDGEYQNGFYAVAGTYNEGAMGINHNGVPVIQFHWNGQGEGFFGCGGNLKIQAGIGSYKTYFVGNVDFEEATVTGLPSVIAKFG